MEEKINIDCQLLKNIFKSEASKLVGKVCKRFELSEDKNQIKVQCKEIIYEALRDICDLIIACSNAKESIHLIRQSKEE